MLEFFKPYIGEMITGVLALSLGWIGKSKTSKKSDEADLTKKIQEVYKELVNDTDKNMDGLREKVTKLEQKLQTSDQEWRKKIEEIQKNWQTKYSRLQSKYNTLLKDFEQYKSNHK